MVGSSSGTASNVGTASGRNTVTSTIGLTGSEGSTGLGAPRFVSGFGIGESISGAQGGQTTSSTTLGAAAKLRDRFNLSQAGAGSTNTAAAAGNSKAATKTFGGVEAKTGPDYSLSKSFGGSSSYSRSFGK